MSSSGREPLARKANIRADVGPLLKHLFLAELARSAAIRLVGAVRGIKRRIGSGAGLDVALASVCRIACDAGSGFRLLRGFRADFA